MAIYCKPKAIAYFGLMHLVATNLCVWFNVIIEETKQEILHYQETASIRLSITRTIRLEKFSRRIPNDTYIRRVEISRCRQPISYWRAEAQTTCKSHF